MKNRRQLMTWSLLLPATLLLAACGSDHETAGTAETLEPVEARLASAERVDAIERVELHGTVRAERNATVSTRVMAAVTAVRVRGGDSVRKGQLLVEIDPQAAQGQEAQARGALGQAQAALAMARRNFERFEALAAEDAASEMELDQARMQFDQARGAVEQAEGALAASSAVAAESRVVAPFDGRIARRMVEVGDMAAPGRPLFAIESAGPRRLVVTCPESLLIRPGHARGDPDAGVVDSRPARGRVDATVVETTPGADPTSHASEVEIELPAVELRTGASGRVWIPAGSRSSVVVPRGAVLRRGGTTLVVVLDEDGRAGSRVVTLGATHADGRVEVLSGLAGDETVAVGLAAAPPTGTPIERREGSR